MFLFFILMYIFIEVITMRTEKNKTKWIHIFDTISHAFTVRIVLNYRIEDSIYMSKM